MIQLKIKVTKEILEKSKGCSFGKVLTGESCGIALAVRDVFPNAYVGKTAIDVNGFLSPYNEIIHLPEIAQRFINAFDYATPSDRVKMPELEFTVYIPDEIIDRINIDELRPLLINHPTLELV